MKGYHYLQTQALLPGGILLGCERDERPLQLAHEAFAEACLSDKVISKLKPTRGG